ncbi:MAG: hypothetical protein EXR71_08080 [Myxococcales bacterium]|nr:hypothetical protein [Myxococcales bacterium]
MTRALLVAAALVMAACTPEPEPDDWARYAGPSLAHVVPPSPVEGVAVSLTVTATDPDGVAQVALYYRTAGDGTWRPAATAATGDSYAVVVPAESVEAPGLEYYFKAIDLGDPAAMSDLPTAGPSQPFSLPVTVIGRTMPYTEDFEFDETEFAAIETAGWVNSSLTFKGYAWELSATQAQSGSYAVYHARGSSEVAIPPDDWLVSPPIDLKAVADAQVRWQEYAVSPGRARHGLYISTGSSDPADGAYVAVAEDLPPAADRAWGESANYDLSAWVGNVVYLAWRFEGTDGDDWYLDDVEVTALEPDLSATFVVTPAPIYPGNSGAIVVTVTNAATVAAAEVSVTVAFPDGGASVAAATQSVGGLAAGASVDAPFELSIDPTTADNSYVPVTVTVSAADRLETLTGKVLVGQSSSAAVDWEGLSEGTLKLVVGVGDHDAPDWSTVLVSGTAPADVTRYAADITDAWAFLPPEAGSRRWWVEADSESGGIIQSFSIRYGGGSVESTMVPLAVDALGSGVCYLPAPPDLSVSALTTSPPELDPGTTGFTVSFTATNLGAETSGPVWATLESTDADLTITVGGPVEVDPDLFEYGERITLSDAFIANVAANHVDSKDLTAQVVLSDGVETWTVPVAFAVPFPVPTITGVTIDDDGGDGILDPDESAELEFRVTNLGDESTSGQVIAVLSVEASSTAGAVADDNDESVGALSPGDTNTVDRLYVDVDSSAAGDTVDLLLTLTDNLRTYEARLQLVLGDAPWQPMSDVGDAEGDLVVPGDFDVVSGTYRYVDGTLQMRLVSRDSSDQAHLFVEAWATSPAADYGIYRMLAQSGIGSLQGYDFSSGTFYDLDDPTVSYPDANTVQFDLPVEYMKLTFQEISIGFGAGWCGEPDYYCDHYPDRWGYPYTGYDTTDWFNMEW